MATSDVHVAREDINTAVREYLQQLYGVTNSDVQTLIARFMEDYVHAANPNQPSTSDMVNKWNYLLSCARGAETT